MDKFRIAVIRVVTIDDQEKLSLHGKLLEKYFPLFTTTSYCIPDQYDGIYDQVTYQKALPKIIALAERIAGEQDGLIISCAGDPAVRELKSRLAIPVSGAGMPTAVFSLNYGEQIGVLGIEESPPAIYRSVLGKKMLAYQKPTAVANTNDLLTEAGRDSLLVAASELKASGSEALALACTGMSTIGIAPFLERSLHLPVIDPVIAEGLYLYERCLAKHKQEAGID
ncbi:MAG: aspartate/glutamate racemase family protein [Halanaerobiales bacterium]|nr:aspartate/glutamate racemase family protein [Halanaerobiales bacterium]